MVETDTEVLMSLTCPWSSFLVTMGANFTILTSFDSMRPVIFYGLPTLGMFMVVPFVFHLAATDQMVDLGLLNILASAHFCTPL